MKRDAEEKIILIKDISLNSVQLEYQREEYSIMI